MADTAITTYLTKQIKVNQNIVTFRLLSRALSIHVNEAKAALESFYQADKKSGGGGSLHATYILTGEDITQKVESESMDVDGDQDLHDAPSPMADAIVPLKMLVVPEECLESCKSSFRSIRAIHIYSVEPSTFRDPSLLATTVDAVRKVDAARTQEELCTLGIPISKACKYNTNIKGKPKVAQTSTPVISGKAQAAKDDKGKKSEVKTETKSTAPAAALTTTAAKPEAKVEPAKKTTSTLDWSKAKSKTATTNPKPQEKVAESSKAAAKVKPEPQKTNAARAPSVSSSAASEAPQKKRGIKRAMVDSDDEEREEDPRPAKAKAKARTSAPTTSTSIAHAKKGVLVSDDEDEEEDAPRSRVVRGKAKSERAMMEWSDEEDVMVAARHTPGPPSTKFDTGGEDEDEDEAEAEQSSLGEEEVMETSDKEDEPTYAKTKRTTKKKKKTAWPVGTNGLRKRRVLKTREFEDDRGFMQYEDYSEYESVNSESEQPPEPVSVSVSATTTTKKAAQKTASTSKPQKQQQQQQQQQDVKKFTKAVPPPAANKEGDNAAKAKPKAPAKGTGKNTIASFFQKK